MKSDRGRLDEEPRMKLTPEQWKEVLDRPETKEAIHQFMVAYHRRVNERLLKDLHAPWWLAAIGWALLVTVPVGVVYLIQRCADHG